MKFLLFFILIISFYSCKKNEKIKRPNIILVMTDDQGWGQTGYYNHPVLDTPNLDAMAKNGIRFDRFYAGAPVCSPTRASVLTGRSNDRTGVFNHGYALRNQEKTITQALKKNGYATGHFGKWHLSGLRGPGVPQFKEDTHHPGNFGFDYWISTTNFFDIDPLMSDNGKFTDYIGSSSKVIFSEALKFIKKNKNKNIPFFAVIWDGSPHDPWVASSKDKNNFKELDKDSQNHYGELVAFDRNLGYLREELKAMDISQNTILWFCSDNGGLKKINPTTVAELRGFKGSVWEGGLRVPGIIEWPSNIKHKITSFPASTMDIFPTIAEIIELDKSNFIEPVDGISLVPLFNSKIKRRGKKIPFSFNDQGALIDNNFKLVVNSYKEMQFELYDIQIDPKELKNIALQNPKVFNKMKSEYLNWKESVISSVKGNDYPGDTLFNQPFRRFWMNDKKYEPFLKEFIKRPEYEKRIKRRK